MNAGDVRIPDLNYGYSSFDHLPSAFLTIFQCITLEGWINVSNMYEDAYHVWFVDVYFLLCIIVCSFFVLNLTILLNACTIVGVDGWCSLQAARDYLDLLEQNVCHSECQACKLLVLARPHITCGFELSIRCADLAFPLCTFRCSSFGVSRPF